MTKKQGFTLAEVLITLGIIGIVAAVTIPTLVSNYQNQQYVTSLKKVYAETNQALKQMSADNGCVDDLKCTGLFAAGTTDDTLGTELVKYFKVIKNCGTAADKGCFAANTFNNYDNSGGTYPYDSGSYYKFITANGMSFLVHSFAPDGGGHIDCGWSFSSGVTGNLNQMCGYLFVDVNGLKGPNTMGRDTFQFYITNGKGALLYPLGGADAPTTWWKAQNYCTPTNKDGGACAARIMEEGWNMYY